MRLRSMQLADFAYNCLMRFKYRIQIQATAFVPMLLKKRLNLTVVTRKPRFLLICCGGL